LHPPLPSRQAPPTADVAPSFPILEQRAETTLEDYVAGIVWAPDSRQFAVAGGEGQVFLGNITASGLSARPIGEHLLGVLDIAWQPKGEHLATAGQDGTVALWNAAGQEAKRWRPAPVTTDRLAFAPGGQLLATASGRHANVWNAQGELVHAFPPAAKAIAGLAFDKSGQHLGAASVGEVAVHTAAIAPGAAVFGAIETAKLKQALRDTRIVRQRLFRATTGSFSWSWKPPAAT